MSELMIESIIFPWFCAALVGFIYHQMKKLHKELDIVKQSLAQKDKLLGAISQALSEIDTKLMVQDEHIRSLRRGTTYGQGHDAVLKESIVNNYERAKVLMRNRANQSGDVLKNCDITPEELELLSDINAPEVLDEA